MPLPSLFGKRVKLTDAGFWSAWFGFDNYTDKIVTPQSTLQLATAWSCQRLISETIGILSLPVYARGAGDARTVASDHWLYGLVHDDPNAEDTAPEFWERVGLHLAGWGNAYAQKESGRAGRIIALTPMPPETKVDRDPVAGLRRYTFSDRGKSYTLPADQVFHIRGWGGGDTGLSPIAYARNSLGIAMAAEESAGRVFKNGLQIGGFISSKLGFKGTQRDDFQTIIDKWVGSKNAGKVMALPGDLEFKPVTMNPADAQLLTSRAWSVEEICRWWRIPPFMVGHTEKSTSWGTGLEQQLIAFLTFAEQPYLTRIQSAIRKQLLPAAERGKFYAEFNVDTLLRSDSAARAALISSMVQNGIYTRNFIRAKENLPPEPGGDLLTVQSALVPLDQLGKVPTADQQAMEGIRRAVKEPGGVDKSTGNGES